MELRFTGQNATTDNGLGQAFNGLAPFAAVHSFEQFHEGVKMPSSPYHALIVDDEPDACRLTTRIFQQRGFLVDTAATGREALQLLASQKYDVLITDLKMPDINGHQVAGELLTKSQRPVIIVVTGVTEPKIERDLRARGVDEFLFKPINNARLAERVQTLIEQRAAQAALAKSAIAPAPCGSLPEPAQTKNSQAAAGVQTVNGSRVSGQLEPCPSVAKAQVWDDAFSFQDSSPRAQPQFAANNKNGRLGDQLERLLADLPLIGVDINLRWLGFLVTFHAGMLVGWLLGKCAG